MRIEAERNAAVEELHLTEALLAKDYFTAAVAQQPAGESDKELPATLRIIESHGDQVGISFSRHIEHNCSGHLHLEARWTGAPGEFVSLECHSVMKQIACNFLLMGL